MENAIVDTIFVTGYAIAILFILATTALILSVVYALSVSAFKGIVNKLMKEYMIIYYNTSESEIMGLQARLYAVSKSDAVRRFRLNYGYRFRVTEVEKCT